MSVEKVSRLHAQLEDLRRERERLHREVNERWRKIREIDELILRFLGTKSDALREQSQKREQNRVQRRKKK